MGANPHGFFSLEAMGDDFHGFFTMKEE